MYYYAELNPSTMVCMSVGQYETEEYVPEKWRAQVEEKLSEAE